MNEDKMIKMLIWKHHELFDILSMKDKVVGIKPIGLTGKKGSGKDTVFLLMKEMYPEVQQVSFSRIMKLSVSKLLGISLEDIEEWKRNDDIGIQIVDAHRGGLDSPMPFRQFLQRYGTESHRDIFGSNFWVDAVINEMYSVMESGLVPVFTDVRFPNEADFISDHSGTIFNIVGLDEDDEDSHDSELGLGEKYQDIPIIYNTCRHVNEDGSPDMGCLREAITNALGSML